METVNFKVALKTFKHFADDSHARFQERWHEDKFLVILNKQDLIINYTAESFARISWISWW